MKKLMILALLLSVPTFALDHIVTVGGGFSIPMGDFAQKTDASNAGFAQFGFGGRVEYDLHFGESGLCWSSSFSYLTNDYQPDYFSHGLNIVLQETGAYSNYAMMTGLKFQKEVADNVALFAVAQGGYSISKGPFVNGFVDLDQDTPPFVEFQMDNSSGKGFSFGFGVVTNETTTIQLRYFSLGSPTYSAIAEYSENEVSKSVAVGWTQPVSMIFLTVGYAIDLGL